MEPPGKPGNNNGPPEPSCLRDQLREALLPHGNQVVLAFVHVSVAAGEESADSDVDRLLVGDPIHGFLLIKWSFLNCYSRHE